jgi:cell division protein FtsI (penicillin-binding protein 3)
MSHETHTVGAGRLGFTLAALGLGILALAWRALDLQVLDRQFLQDQGEARHLRTQPITAHRGMILDRNGEPLAISVPVDSVWGNPQELMGAREHWRRLASALDIDYADMQSRIRRRADREFLYLRRHVDPDMARRVMALGIPGVSLQREYRRYYPEGEVAAHIVGFTDVDDVGQEGAELAYDDSLRGSSGAKWVIKDRFGRVVEDVAAIKDPAPGHDLTLSIDRRIQYLAYRELKAAVQAHHADAGSLVMLDVRTGEVLAMANQPSYNPNNRDSMRADVFRNRAVTDLVEPGSTVKPFTIAAALDAGLYRPDSRIETAPGYFRVGHSLVRDASNYGLIDVTTVLEKSSNVGASKIALSIPPQKMWQTFSGVGFGSLTGAGFPGEVSGSLPYYSRWREVERATLSFGYGLAVTPLQLTLAYSVLGDGGRLKPPSFLPVTGPVETRQVIGPRTAAAVVHMMESVVSEHGTGMQASVDGYRVAGKTGTVQMLDEGGYSNERYVALFAGLAPANEPRLAMAVIVKRPRGKQYYGGQVAAPVFSRVMAGALRILGVAPDAGPARQWYARDAGEDADGLAPAPVDGLAEAAELRRRLLPNGSKEVM